MAPSSPTRATIARRRRDSERLHRRLSRKQKRSQNRKKEKAPTGKSLSEGTTAARGFRPQAGKHARHHLTISLPTKTFKIRNMKSQPPPREIHRRRGLGYIPALGALLRERSTTSRRWRWSPPSPLRSAVAAGASSRNPSPCERICALAAGWCSTGRERRAHIFSKALSLYPGAQGNSLLLIGGGNAWGRRDRYCRAREGYGSKPSRGTRNPHFSKVGECQYRLLGAENKFFLLLSKRRNPKRLHEDNLHFEIHRIGGICQKEASPWIALYTNRYKDN